LPWENVGGWDDLTPQTRRLLRHTHGREQCGLADLAEVVWERPYADVSDSAVHAALSKANHFLNKCGLPNQRLLTKVRGEPVVRWV
jgi:hypothetical protein